MTDEGGEIVNRYAFVVFAAVGTASHRVQSIGPGGAWNRGEPAVAQSKFGGQVIVSEKFFVVVIPHHEIPLGVLRVSRNVVFDETAVVVCQLIRHALAAMAWILVCLESGVSKRMDGIIFLSVVVVQTGGQPVCVGSVSFQLQITEHMVEGSVLHQ